MSKFYNAFKLLCNIAYNQILSTLSTDYNNLKNYCNIKGANCKDFPSIPEITPNISVQISEVTSSSSSLGNKLFLFYRYLYSLFGFQKRAQKQYLREKIKNIKKKINR
ncbi:PIR protein [Plasmodium yoelii yoelii]|uniref:PIR protein n=1 Tax=Plasmodium yoelii yoelii TaxID=73239 RepID=A0AAF0B6R3_PLAYO|nr:PIR protein [Plasmodium yoelii yoelii]